MRPLCAEKRLVYEPLPRQHQVSLPAVGSLQIKGMPRTPSRNIKNELIELLCVVYHGLSFCYQCLTRFFLCVIMFHLVQVSSSLNSRRTMSHDRKKLPALREGYETYEPAPLQQSETRAEAAPAVLKWSGQEVGGAMSSGGCG